MNIPADHRRSQAAFSLMEVMIAIGIFFMCIFVILALVSSSLANARRLQRPMVDAAMLASEFSLTNKIVEGSQSGDFGKIYPGYSWKSETSEVQTNGLYQVDFVVFRDNPQEIVQKMSVLYFSATSAGSLDGATVSK